MRLSSVHVQFDVKLPVRTECGYVCAHGQHTAQQRTFHVGQGVIDVVHVCDVDNFDVIRFFKRRIGIYFNDSRWVFVEIALRGSKRLRIFHFTVATRQAFQYFYGKFFIR